MQLIERTKPLLVIGSPPCTAFSRLQELSRHKRDAGIVRAEIDHAVEHVRFCADVYKTQLKSGRLFLHEHPHTAKHKRAEETSKVVDKRRE